MTGASTSTHGICPLARTGHHSNYETETETETYTTSESYSNSNTAPSHQNGKKTQRSLGLHWAAGNGLRRFTILRCLCTLCYPMATTHNKTGSPQLWSTRCPPTLCLCLHVSSHQIPAGQCQRGPRISSWHNTHPTLARCPPPSQCITKNCCWPIWHSSCSQRKGGC